MIEEETENYKKMYLHLFNMVTDALDAIGQGNYDEAASILRSAQVEAEEIYIDNKS